MISIPSSNDAKAIQLKPLLAEDLRGLLEEVESVELAHFLKCPERDLS